MHSKCIPLSPVVLRFGGDTKRSSVCRERKRSKRCPRFAAFAAFAASEDEDDEKETQKSAGETVLVVTGCLGFIGSNLVSHLLERGNDDDKDDNDNEFVTIIGIDVLDVEKGPYKKEDKRANLNRLMQIGKRRFVFIDRVISLGIELSMIERELRKRNKKKDEDFDDDFDAEDDSNVFKTIDGIIHCAAYSGVKDTLEDPMLAFRANVETTAIMIELAKRARANFVFLSSGATYGDNFERRKPSREDEGIMGDDGKSMPQSPYALSKIAAEAVVRSYARAFTEIERRITITRIFTCFGNYGRSDMAITRFMQTLLDEENREKKLTMFGDGDESWRDYCHVADVCSGIEKALWRENGSTCETVNVSRGEAVSLRRLVSSVQKAASEELKASSPSSSEPDDDIKIIVEPRRPGDVGGTFADVTKAKDLLDFEAKISLEEGVASVAKWYNSDEYKKHYFKR